MRIDNLIMWPKKVDINNLQSLTDDELLEQSKLASQHARSIVIELVNGAKGLIVFVPALILLSYLPAELMLYFGFDTLGVAYAILTGVVLLYMDIRLADKAKYYWSDKISAEIHRRIGQPK